MFKDLGPHSILKDGQVLHISIHVDLIYDVTLFHSSETKHILLMGAGILQIARAEAYIKGYCDSVYYTKKTL